MHVRESVNWPGILEFMDSFSDNVSVSHLKAVMHLFRAQTLRIKQKAHEDGCHAMLECMLKVKHLLDVSVDPRFNVQSSQKR